MKKSSNSLVKFAYLSLLAAIVTITLKFYAYFLTGSVGLLSDALESVVNLVAAVTAIFILQLSEKPPDDKHVYGHSKAEYFSSVFEGILILIAAVTIIYSSYEKILKPTAISDPYIGLIIAGLASCVNGGVAWYLFIIAKKHKSIVLEADAHHLMTDVYTSIGVIGGLILTAITRLYIIDPIIALLVAINIIFTGVSIIKKSASGLMDIVIPENELNILNDILEKYKKNDVEFHGVRTRQSGVRRFVSLHVLVPGSWSVKQGHDLCEQIESTIRKNIQKVSVFTHLEPVEDPRSMDDIALDRQIQEESNY
ncbi:MAG: cation diffusion facilitator family transporter [Candidatus Roizmanbacteria bacterium]